MDLENNVRIYLRLFEECRIVLPHAGEAVVSMMGALATKVLHNGLSAFLFVEEVIDVVGQLKTPIVCWQAEATIRTYHSVRLG